MSDNDSYIYINFVNALKKKIHKFTSDTIVTNFSYYALQRIS